MWPFRKKTPGSVRSVTADPFLGDARAKQLHEALAARDWATARAILTAPVSNDDRAFYMEIAAHVPGIQDWIEGPIRDEPHSSLPLLVRGAHAVFWAWEARGSGRSDSVAQEQWKVWFRRLKLAEDCLDEVVEKDPKCLEAWNFLVILGRARQLPKAECWQRFNNLAAIDPTHHYGHDQMLQNLCAKWSGSAQEMFAFARDRGAGAPGTALPAMIASAHLEHRWDNGGPEYMEQPEVGDEIVAAAHQSIWHPSYQRTLATPYLWNRFALAFSLADRFAEAERCYQEIGTRYFIDYGWDPKYFAKLRDYVASNLAKQGA